VAYLITDSLACIRCLNSSYT